MTLTTLSAACRGALASLGLAAATVLAPAVAQASPITVNFSGVVTSVGDDGSGLFASTFAAGQAVQGSWSFDSAATGTQQLSYDTSYPATFSVTIGGQTFGGDIEYRIFDDAGAGGDGFSIVNEDADYSVPVGLSPLVASTFFLQMLGMPTTTLSGQGLVTDPAALWNLANPSYAPNGLRLDNPTDGSYGLLYFAVTDMSNAVPEPGTVPLVAGALLALGASVRRRAGVQAAA